MLSKEENALLTRVGPETPMGELLRRYWWPVGFAEELTAKPRRTKLLGEEFVLYRGADGRPSLLDLRCAHRGVALDYGRVEGECLRCPYHGWLYDRSGQCVEMPAEPESSTFKDRVKLGAYPAQEFSGLVFGYFGPLPAPELPRYDVLARTDGVKWVLTQPAHANWLNHVENIVDVSHLAWLHGSRFPHYGARKVSYEWQRTRYGLNNIMRIEGVEQTHVSCYAFPAVNRFTLPPVAGNDTLVGAVIYRVPVDDESTLLYFTRFYPSDTHSLTTAGYQHRELGVYQPLEEDWWGIDFNDQDRMVVEQQGIFSNREKEHLGASDEGIIVVRRLMREALAAIEAGQDPLGVIRDPADDVVIDLGAQADMYTGVRTPTAEELLARV